LIAATICSAAIAETFLGRTFSKDIESLLSWAVCHLAKLYDSITDAD
jgi:hypothetical protein